MSHAIVSHTTPELLLAASVLVRLAHPANCSLHRALDKAQARLSTQPWRLYDGHLEIVSASHPNQIQSADADYCSCKTTRGICWHRAAWHLLAAIAGAGGIVSPALPLPDMGAVDDAPDWDDYGHFLDVQPIRELVPVAGSRMAQAQANADLYF